MTLKFNLNKSIAAKIVLAIVVITAVISSAYFYMQYQKTKNLLQNPAAVTEEEKQALLAKVGKLILLPAGESPTIATIKDMEKLKTQPFFINAQNEDKVLVYTDARKAILYRPSANQIIDVAPVNISSNSATPAVDSIIRIALYNGTNTVGLTSQVEKLLKEKLTNVKVVLKDNAKQSNYDKTLVIDLSKSAAVEAKAIAGLLKAQEGNLPENEDKPVVPAEGPVDILVILGKDFMGK